MQADVEANTKAIADEVTRAKAAEQENATDISNETSRAKNAEADITTALNQEVDRAQAAEKDLSDYAHDVKKYAEANRGMIEELAGGTFADKYKLDFGNGINAELSDDGKTYTISVGVANGVADKN